MGKFSDLIVFKLPGRWVWEVMQPFTYDHPATDTCSFAGKITVPVGFQSDGASVPPIPVIYEELREATFHAAVIHDYLYRIDSNPVVDEDTANRLLYDGMIDEGVPIKKAKAIYDGVVMGGRFNFHKKYVKEAI